MRIGFTGTREGCTDEQHARLRAEIDRLHSQGAYAAHHGDCIGADAEFHDVCKGVGLWLVIHPPLVPRLRAFKPGNDTRVAKQYYPRNRDIVDETDVLVACPNDGPRRPNSGTWYTIGYAEQKRKPIILIHADGSVRRINER